MKFLKASVLASFAVAVSAQDLLFVDTFEFQEFADATASGFTTKVVTEAEFRTMTTSDFSKFKAIIMADPSCGFGTDSIQFLDDTKTTWSPAVTGNIILIGTDPSFHFAGQPGAGVLIHNAIGFAAAGASTGLYFALSCYYGSSETSDVSVLSEFGKFTVRGNLGCYNNAHIVASSPALGPLGDVALSNWSCSVHEAFSAYPTTGVNGFQALAIARDIIGVGSQTFGDTSIGLPYIISRGATPAACGDGKWNPSLGEECDDGNTINGDGCSLSCKCESGRPKGDGTCFPPTVSASRSTSSSTISSSSSTSSSTKVSSLTSSSSSKSTSASSSKSNPASDSSSGDSDATATSTSGPSLSKSIYYAPSSIIYANSTTLNSPISVTSSASYGYPSIIGVEVIVIVEVIEDCSTVGSETFTSYTTKPCSTLNRPIYNSDKPGFPCYICALSSEGYSFPSSSFITATTTSCTKSPPGYTHIPSPPVLYTCHTCAPITLSTCPSVPSPLPSGEPDYIIVAPSDVPHDHYSSQIETETSNYPVPYTTPALAPYATASAPAYSPVPTIGYTPSPAPYTGGAAGLRSMFVTTIGGLAAFAAAALL